MFDDTTIKILGDSYVNIPIKTFDGDLQDNTSTIDKDEYSYICTKLLFVDYIEPLIYENAYLDVNNKIYKIIKVDTCSDHMEVYLFYYNLKDIKINNIDKKVLIEETTEKIAILDEKLIVSDFEIKTGDLVEFQSNKWLIISEIATSNNEYRGRMRKCNNNLRYKASVDEVETIISIPTIIDSGTISIAEGQYFATVDNQLSCKVPYSLIDKIKPIAIGVRFILNNSVWKVLGLDDITNVLYKEQGIIIIKLESDTFMAEDDKILEIAYNTLEIVITTPHDYTITTESSKSLQNTRSSQITVECTKDGEIVEVPVLTYTAGDITICTVNSTGVMTGVSEGSTIITTTYQGVSTVINITIVAKIEIYSLIGATSINEAVSQQFKIIDESGTDSTLEYTFKISDITLASIESIGTNYVNLIGKNIKGSVTLTVTNKLNTSLVYTKSISTLYNAHTFTVDISETNADIEEEQTHQLVISATDNGVVVSSPVVTYSSDNEAISTVDANGLVTAISVGTNTIIVAYENVTNSIAINVTAKAVAPSYQIITSTTTASNYYYILNGNARTQKVYNADLTPITDGTTFTFTLEASTRHDTTATPQQLITLMDAITTTQCRITANNVPYKGWFWIVATSNLGAIVKREMLILGQYDNKANFD